MALALASSPALVSGVGSDLTTASFSPPADSVLVAAIQIESAASTTISNSGTGLTWTPAIVRTSAQSGISSYAAIYTAPNVNAQSNITVTATTGSGDGGLKVYVFTGADLDEPVGATGSGTTANNSSTVNGYTSTTDGSWGVCSACASSDNGLKSSSDVEDAWNGLDRGGMAVRKASASGSAPTGVTFNLVSSDALDRFCWVAAEIQEQQAFPQTVTPTGVASDEAFGTPQGNFTVTASGIASGEVVGDLVISTPDPLFIAPSGIASAEAFGTLTTRLYLSPAGVASAEAFGSLRMAALIGPTGIPSAEAFGTTNVAIEQFITPAGLATAEAFGTLTLQIGYPQTVIPSGIESREVVEDPTVRLLHRLMLVNPSIQETPVAWDRLNARFGIHRGITIMRDAGGAWSSVRYPAQTEIEEASTVYMGGRRHALTVAEAEELTDAGYGAYIELELIT